MSQVSRKAYSDYVENQRQKKNTTSSTEHAHATESLSRPSSPGSFLKLLSWPLRASSNSNIADSISERLNRSLSTSISNHTGTLPNDTKQRKAIKVGEEIGALELVFNHGINHDTDDGDISRKNELSRQKVKAWCIQYTSPYTPDMLHETDILSIESLIPRWCINKHISCKNILNLEDGSLYLAQAYINIVLHQQILSSSDGLIYHGEAWKSGVLNEAIDVLRNQMSQSGIEDEHVRLWETVTFNALTKDNPTAPNTDTSSEDSDTQKLTDFILDNLQKFRTLEESADVWFQKNVVFLASSLLIELQKRKFQLEYNFRLSDSEGKLHFEDHWMEDIDGRSTFGKSPEVLLVIAPVLWRSKDFDGKHISPPIILSKAKVLLDM